MKCLGILTLLTLSSLVGLSQPILPSTPLKTNINITLAWDLSPSTNVVGYILRRGVRSGQYDQMMVIPSATATTAVWTNAPSNVTNYFMATAYTASGLESDPSNEVGLVMERRPLSPQLRTAVPITVFIESKGENGMWATRHVLGPFYTLTETGHEEFRTRLAVTSAVEVMPP